MKIRVILGSSLALSLLALVPVLRAQSYAFSTFFTETTTNSTLSGVDVDGAGNVYAASDPSGRVYRLSPSGTATTIASILHSRYALLTGPSDVAVTSDGRVYAANYLAGTIMGIPPGGGTSVAFGLTDADGSADGTAASARFFIPRGLVADRSDNLYVADTGNHTIRKITPAGLVSTVAGSPGHPGNADGSGSAAQFNYPYDIAIDTAGNLYVADSGNNQVRKITPAGLVSTIAGPTAPPGDAPLKSPTGVAVDAAGNVFFADSGNRTIRKITPAGAISTIGGQYGQAGTTDGTAGLARFNSPYRLALDSGGTLYIADGKSIRRGVPTNAPAVPVITAPLASSTLAVGPGADVTLTVAANAPTTLGYQWLKNRVPIPGAAGTTLTLPAVTPADAGIYAVVVSNPAGAVTSNATTLTVSVPTQTTFARRRTQPGGSFLWSIAAGNGQLVTVGTNGTILTSEDGTTWTARVSGTADWLTGVTYGAGKFVAVGDRGRILLSTDGVTWATATDAGTTQRLNNVLFAAGLFVAVGENGSIVTSADAVRWTPRVSNVAGWLRGLTYNENIGYFAASGQKGTLLKSADGIVWEKESVSGFDATLNLEAVVAVRSYADFVGIGTSGATMFANFVPAATALAATWNTGTQSTGASFVFRGLAQAASALFATGERGVILSAPSVFGPWSSVPSGTTANLVSGVYFGGSLFIVGENETILQSDSLFNSRLLNISTRAQVGTDANAMISGFVIKGSVPKQVLVRAAGPALGGFGLPGSLAAPVLTLFDGTGNPVAANTGWSTGGNTAAITAAAARVGAFHFATGSADSALLLTLNPGLYTAQVTGRNATTGLCLIETYDTESLANDAPRAVNIPTRASVGTGPNKMIAGFVIGGAAARRVLIRASGPTLTAFGLPGALAEPQLELFNSSGNLAGVWTFNPATDPETRAAAQTVGGFALVDGSHDVSVVTTLLPGLWTAQVSGVANTTGVALIEVYDLP